MPYVATARVSHGEEMSGESLCFYWCSQRKRNRLRSLTALQHCQSSLSPSLHCVSYETLEEISICFFSVTLRVASNTFVAKSVIDCSPKKWRQIVSTTYHLLIRFFLFVSLCFFSVEDFLGTYLLRAIVQRQFGGLNSFVLRWLIVFDWIAHLVIFLLQLPRPPLRILRRKCAASK